MQASQLLQAVADSLSDPIFIIDRDGRYLEVLGANARDDYDSGRYLKGRTLHQVLPAAKADRFLGWIRQVLDQGQVLRYEFCLSADECDGNRREGPRGEQWFEARVSPVENLPPGEVPCVVWLVVNITRHKALQRQLQYMAVSDALTGLSNRHAFDALLPTMLAEHRRRKEVLTLALLDLDHFKRVNDRFGHPAGDALLRRFAAMLQDYLRAGDVPVRLGGEEFGLLMPHTRLAEALRVLQRLRTQLKVDVPQDDQGRKIELTFSAGVLEVQDCADAAEAYRRVDALLYRAKHAGRDQVFGPSRLNG